MAIRALIVDDEPLARERLAGLLRQVSDVAVVGQCGDGRSAVGLIGQHDPDLVLLDIQLPEADGFEVLGALPQGRAPSVIFVTAYDRFAVRAFEANAVDYLLKPVELERLKVAMDRIRDRSISHRQVDMQTELLRVMQCIQPSGEHPSRILVKSDDGIMCLMPSEIDWVESAGNYACFHIGAQTRIARETMSGIESRLAKHNFVRIHRSSIVNLERVCRLKLLPYGDGEIELRDGTKLQMSRSYRQAVTGKLRSLDEIKP